VPKPVAPEVEVKSEPAKEDVKIDEAPENTEHNGAGGEEKYNGDHDMDDEIDFNLGGNGNNYDAPVSHEAHGPGIKEDG
jgi:hypothetical protein